MRTRQASIHSRYGAVATAREVIGDTRHDGAVAVVTGGHGGVGLETTRALAHAGVTVVVAARTPEKAAAAGERCPRARAQGTDRLQHEAD